MSKTSNTTKPPAEECLCNDYDGQGKSTCGFDCPVHQSEGKAGWEVSYNQIFGKTLWQQIKPKESILKGGEE